MAFPPGLTRSLLTYLINNKLKGRGRFPLVLMLEPIVVCNLSCTGCGRIREFRHVVDKTLTVEQCLRAVEEAGAPVVSITGGEPLLHADIDRIVEQIAARKKYIHLCTNGLLLQSSLSKFCAGRYLSFVVHLDGLSETHDRLAGRQGVYETAIAGIRAAKGGGFRVLVNTTIYKQTEVAEVEQLWNSLSTIGVDGLMVSPAFDYDSVGSDVFLSRQEISKTFRPLFALRHKLPFYNTPLYMEFLAGKRELLCRPWSTPTRTVLGWKSPCYLITDRYFPTYRELMEQTRWASYGAGNDPRCANCMVHCGFEADAVRQIGSSVSALWETVRWSVPALRKEKA
jgi:hopanoid biosynthesis associated radical SAM protein HpnH